MVTTMMSKPRRLVWLACSGLVPAAMASMEVLHGYREYAASSGTKEQTTNGGGGQSLFGGKFITSSNVGGILELGRDIVAMDAAENITTAKDIYQNGGPRNNGESLGPNVTLAALSLSITEKELDEPYMAMFRYYMHSLGKANGEEEGLFMGQQAQFYADAIVTDLLEKQVAATYVTEAVLVLNVWMAMATELGNSWTACARDMDKKKSMAALDRAAALWMGEDDSAAAGSAKGLYHLAKEAAGRFGQEGASSVNAKIATTFGFTLHGLLSSDSSCADVKHQMRQEIDRLMNLASIPLLQNLMHYVLSEESEDMTRVYMVTVLPQMVACDPNLGSRLSLEVASGQEAKIEWIHSLQDSFSCLRVSCNEVGTYSHTADFPSCGTSTVLPTLAGYQVSVQDAELYSRIDRDMVRLEILLRTSSFNAAQDLYMYGYHGAFSLFDLASDDVLPTPAGSLYYLFASYYKISSYNFADDELKQALKRQGVYQDLPLEDLVQAIMGILSYEVSFLAVTSALKAAEAKCLDPGDGTGDTAAKYWDYGVALYTGSIEGGTKGGNNGGRLMYGASKTLCSSFDECFENNSRVNNLLSQLFSLGKTYLAQRQCTSLGNLARDYVLPSLQTIQIQGILANSAALVFDDSFILGRRGAVHAFTRSLLPQVHEANAESATVLANELLLSQQGATSTDDFYHVAKALYNALPDMVTDCNSVGTLQTPSLSLCKSIEPQYFLNQITFGRYNFSDKAMADQFASLSLDIRDIALASSVDEALEIYNEGRHAVLQSTFRTSEKISLSSFSREASTLMAQDPMFNIFRFALYDEEAFEDDGGNETHAFADDFVQNLFANSSNLELAAESVVVLNVWMMVAHQLYNVVRTCKAGGDASVNADSALALWIGKEEAEGSSEDWTMYSVAQEAAKGFGLTEEEAPVNQKLINLFNEIQSSTQNCKDDPTSFVGLRHLIRSALQLMSVPLIQQLFLGLASRDETLVELYTMSVIPQAAGCHSSIYPGLSNYLYKMFPEEDFNDAIAKHFAEFWACLDLSCDEFAYEDSATADLKNLVTQVCGTQSNDDDPALAIPSAIIRDASFQISSRLALDILQIDVFMKTRAYEAALDWYQNGYNAHRNDEVFVSLQQLANLQSTTGIDHLEVYEEYYGSSSYADDFVQETMQRQGLYGNATRAQLATGVTAALQAMVVYEGITWNLEQAVEKCKIGSGKRISTEHWVTAISLFTGSSGTSKLGSEFSFHALGLNYCQDFGTCTDGLNSLSNKGALDALYEGYSLFQSLECSQVDDLLNSTIFPSQVDELLKSTIIPLLQVPLVQGTIRSAAVPGENSTISEADEELSGVGFVLAQTILPFVAAVNTESAETINFAFDSPLEKVQFSEDAESVAEAFQFAIPAMGIDCEYLGALVDAPLFGFCHEYDLPTWVVPHSNLGLDVAEIAAALKIGEVDMARLIYTEGKNAVDSELQQKLSLSSFSTKDTLNMTGEPIFNLFVRTYGNDTLYADTFVEKAFESTAGRELVAEATIVLNVWMMIIHEMNQAVTECGNSGENSRQAAAKAIDRAASYWIGDADPEQSGERGHLLYGLTEEIGDRFVSTDEKVPQVNLYMLVLFGKAHTLLEPSGACQLDSSTAMEMHQVLNEITRQMTIPLVQGLINAVKRDLRDRVELYSHAILPLLSTCNETDYDYFQETTLAATYNVVDTERIVDHIYQVLPCLGLKCAQIGVHRSDSPAAPCAAVQQTFSGYRPTHVDEFEERARIDQDLREFDLLMSIEAYAAADRVFEYGRHSDTSLSELAMQIVTGEDDSSWMMNALNNYWDISESYGHLLMRTAIHNKKFVFSAKEQQILATNSAQMMVLPQAALLSLQESSSECSEGNQDAALLAWDRGAALLLGSASITGSNRLSPYDLGQSLCADFDTCESDGVAESNRLLVELLYAGRGTLRGETQDAGLHCEVLTKLRHEIQPLILVPQIQATLHSALILSQKQNRSLENMAYSFVASRALLPLINFVEPDAAKGVEELLPYPAASRDFTRTTAAKVMDILAPLYDTWNVECELIGTLENLKPCKSNNAVQNESSSISTGLLVGIAAFVCILGVGLAYLCWKRGRRRPKNKSAADDSSHPRFQDERSDSSESSTVVDGQEQTHLVEGSNDDRVNHSYHARSLVEDPTDDRITLSFPSKTPLSRKANKALSRISRFGDDDSTFVDDLTLASSKRPPSKSPFLARHTQGSNSILSDSSHVDII